MLMDTDNGTLRIGIEGRWEASEFSQSLASLDRLYVLRFGLALEKQELNELRELDFDFPFSRGLRSARTFRRWARTSPANLILGQRTNLVIDGRISDLTSELLEADERLVVRRIIYGSPGIKDLVGFGEIIGHLKDFIQFGIEHWSSRRKRSLEDDRLELENKKLQIEIAKGFVDIADSLGYSTQEKRQLVAAVVHEQKPLIQLISDGKIVSAEIVEDSLP
jgi:hypothetical protein